MDGLLAIKFALAYGTEVGLADMISSGTFMYVHVKK
jgi:hypothetical protein